MNYSLTYKVCGHENHMSPDDHYQDIKRIISAANGKARRINVVMPFLYESRQHKRSQRESLDCAFALQELIDMGVSNISHSMPMIPVSAMRFHCMVLTVSILHISISKLCPVPFRICRSTKTI